MPYPSYSYLSPGVLEMSLDLARELRRAASDISDLAYGGAAVYSVGGRAGDKAIAVKDWIGPHHDTFEQLFDNEQQSTVDTMTKLAEEADAWAGFWAVATNARNDRLFDEAMDRHRTSMSVYQDRVDDYQQAVEDDPDNPPLYSLPMPPTAPTRPPAVTAPTFASNYQPTG